MNLKIIKCYGNKFISLKIISLNVKLNKNENPLLSIRAVVWNKIYKREMWMVWLQG